jgi:hypothetical protein
MDLCSVYNILLLSLKLLNNYFSECLNQERCLFSHLSFFEKDLCFRPTSLCLIDVLTLMASSIMLSSLKGFPQSVEDLSLVSSWISSPTE